MIVIKGLSKSYGDTAIFNNLSVKFDSVGKIYTILGESGSGKSTLLNILFGIDQEFTGNYWLFGKKH
jgi:putative ABC transport system permease protein